MIDDFFNHTCDIYHLNKQTKSRGYGLPDATGEGYDYKDHPDISSQVCHFGVKSSNITLIQQESQQDMDARIKLTLPYSVDIRANDKIVSHETGYEYRAEIPRKVQTHHQYVWIKRTYPKSL